MSTSIADLAAKDAARYGSLPARRRPSVQDHLDRVDATFGQGAIPAQVTAPIEQRLGQQTGLDNAATSRWGEWWNQFGNAAQQGVQGQRAASDAAYNQYMANRDMSRKISDHQLWLQNMPKATGGGGGGGGGSSSAASVPLPELVDPYASLGSRTPTTALTPSEFDRLDRFESLGYKPGTHNLTIKGYTAPKPAPKTAPRPAPLRPVSRTARRYS